MRGFTVTKVVFFFNITWMVFPFPYTTSTKRPDNTTQSQKTICNNVNDTKHMKCRGCKDQGHAETIFHDIKFKDSK